MAGSDKGKLRCIIIGAGVSGILIAQKLQEALRDRVIFHIFEKNSDVGGTWFENRYPGCACDVPSHIYQYSFCPNPYWSTVYASSSEIQAYLKAVTFHYGLQHYISFRKKVERAVWCESQHVWQVTVENEGMFECDVLINACGILSNIQWPRLQGLESFKGPFCHTASWNRDVDLEGKSVAVIGAGASAIQLLPAIKKEAKHVDMYIRTPSWITSAIGVAGEDGNHKYTPEEKEKYLDSTYSLTERKKLETTFNIFFRSFAKQGSEQAKLRKELEDLMTKMIPDPEMQKLLIPSFDVGCRRINPGIAYLKALQEDHIQTVFEPIERITPVGVVAGGKLREYDVIVAATGFDTSFRPRFPIIGQRGEDLCNMWEMEPESYCGIAVSGFPNYLTFLGPNTPISNGSVMGILEGTADHFVRLLRKFVVENVLTFNVRADVQRDFDQHTQKFMQNMVWSGTCNSWYKSKTGKVTAIWPGSSLHYRQILAADRWEDYEWTHKGNRFDWWSKGYADIESQEGSDLAYYLELHPNIPLEAYYESAKGYCGNVGPDSAFCPETTGIGRSNFGQESDNLSDSSWETKVEDEIVQKVIPLSGLAA